MDEMRRVADRLHEEILAGVSAADFATTMRVLATVKETLNELDRDRTPGADTKKKKGKTK